MLALLVLATQAAPAQTVRQKPGHLKAQNRKSIRASRRADVPYKDSHLAVGKDRLRRGEAAPRRPDEGEETDNYRHGRAPNAQGSGLFKAKAKHKGGKKTAQSDPKK